MGDEPSLAIKPATGGSPKKATDQLLETINSLWISDFQKDQMTRLVVQVGIDANLENDRLREENEALKQVVGKDPLTGLYSMHAFEERVRVMLGHRSPDRLAALGVGDLRGFKEVNDKLGHALGNKVLVKVGQLLQQCLRRADFASRWGGDEFAFLLMSLDSLEDAHAIARRFRISVKHHHWAGEFPELKGRLLDIDLAVVCVEPIVQVSYENLFQQADKRMLEAKEKKSPFVSISLAEPG